MSPKQGHTARTVTVVRWKAVGEAVTSPDHLAAEEPLEIRIRGHSVAVTMRTPGHDADLAAGFLLTEGIIQRPEDILEIAPCARTDADSTGNVLNVFLAPRVKLDLERLTRHVFASSSCGICGKASIEAVRQCFPSASSGPKLSPRLLTRLPDKLRKVQPLFAQTGGLHAAGLFSARGRLLVAREDVGRHNAVDKVVGHALREGWVPLQKHILLVSGRASFEILQKALAAGIPVVAAISAPSSLAVEFAQESGQTLVGFLRDGAMNVYAHPERLGLDARIS